MENNKLLSAVSRINDAASRVTDEDRRNYALNTPLTNRVFLDESRKSQVLLAFVKETIEQLAVDLIENQQSYMESVSDNQGSLQEDRSAELKQIQNALNRLSGDIERSISQSIAQQKTLANELQQAFKNLISQIPKVNPATSAPIKQWNFKVVRNKQGGIDTITATAQ